MPISYKSLALFAILVILPYIVYATTLMPTSLSGINTSTSLDSFNMKLSSQMIHNIQNNPSILSNLYTLSTDTPIDNTDSTIDEFTKYPYGKTFDLSFTMNNIVYTFTMLIDTEQTDNAEIYEINHNGLSSKPVYALPHVYHATGYDSNGDQAYITVTLRMMDDLSSDNSSSDHATMSSNNISTLDFDTLSDTIHDNIIIEGTLITSHHGIMYLSHIPTLMKRASSEMDAYSTHINTLSQQLVDNTTHTTMNDDVATTMRTSSPYGPLAAEIAVYQNTVTYLQDTISHLSTMLESNAPHNIAIQYLSESSEGLFHGKDACHVIDPKTGLEYQHEHSHDDEHSNDSDDITNTISSILQTGSMQTLFDRTSFLNRFTNCQSNIDNKVKKVNAAFTLTLGYSRMANGSATATVTATSPATLAHFRNVISLVNTIYVKQLGLYIYPGRLEVTTSDSGQTWNSLWPYTADTTRCNVSNILTNYSSYVRDNTLTFKDYAVIHLFTACNPSGTVGTAYIGTACGSDPSYRTGWNVVSGPNSWLTVAHEMGHNYGLPHPFDPSTGLCTLGQGKCGGIMDYANSYLLSTDSLNPKKIGFSVDYDKPKFCSSASNTLSNTYGQCYSDLSVSTCNNNGIVEPGEECDDTSSCCNNCKLVSGATCSGSNSTCCQNCQAQHITTSCTVGSSTTTGWCGVKGQCIASQCPQLCTPVSSSWRSDFAAKCTYFCADPSTGSCTTYYSTTYMPEGSVCSVDSTTQGICTQTGDANFPLPVTVSCQTPVYSWNSVVIKPCDCTNNVTSQIADIICTDQTGNTVSSSYCDASSKPSTSTSCGCEGVVTYGWQRTANGTCQSECKEGYQQYTVRCMVTTGGQSVVTTDNMCTDTKPATIETCYINQCLDDKPKQYTCTQKQTTVSGSSWTTGTCTCLNGWSGDGCSIAPTLTISNLPTRIVPGTTITPKWNNINGIDSATTIAAYMEIPLDNTTTYVSYPLWTGKYTALTFSISFPMSIPTSSTAKFVLVTSSGLIGTQSLPVDAYCQQNGQTCNNNGTCNIYTHQCTCPDGFTGTRCNTDMCTNMACDETGSTGCSKGVCQCKAGYTGTECQYSTMCNAEVLCSEHGDIVGDGTVCDQECTCRGLWGSSGSSGQVECDKCDTSSCIDKRSKMDSACTRCMCLEGYTGTTCQCRILYFTFTVPHKPSYFGTYVDLVAQNKAISSNSNAVSVANLSLQQAFISSIISTFNQQISSTKTVLSLEYWSSSSGSLIITLNASLQTCLDSTTVPTNDGKATIISSLNALYNIINDSNGPFVYIPDSNGTSIDTNNPWVVSVDSIYDPACTTSGESGCTTGVNPLPYNPSEYEQYNSTMNIYNTIYTVVSIVIFAILSVAMY